MHSAAWSRCLHGCLRACHYCIIYCCQKYFFSLKLAPPKIWRPRRLHMSPMPGACPVADLRSKTACIFKWLENVFPLAHDEKAECIFNGGLIQEDAAPTHEK